MRIGLLLLALVIPSLGWSQSNRPILRIEPGSDYLVRGRVSEGTDTLVVVSGNGKEVSAVGLVYLETHSHQRDGADVLTRIEWLRGVGDPVVADSFVLVHPSLAPLSATPLGEAGPDHLRFEGQYVVHSDENGDTTRVPVESAAFYGNSVDVVLRSLPLGAGFEAVLPFYEADARSISDALVTVGELEDIRSASGEICAAWPVRVNSSGHGGTYWIDSRSYSLVRYQAPSHPLYLLRSRCAAASAGK